MKDVDFSKCVQVASKAAREAGALLNKHVGEPAKVETKKSPADLVTEIDRASEKIIQDRLKRSFPDFSFLGEEQGAVAADSDYRWIVDPIDGTTNFVHGIPFFGVSIALEHKGKMAVGVIYDPCRDEMFTAVKGQGAMLNGKPIRVSRTRRLSHSVLATGFSSRFRRTREPFLSWFTSFERTSHGVRRMSSTVLCLAYIAAGRMEGFYEIDLKPWDIAAGVLIVQEAGGRVTTTEGEAFVLEKGDLVASNRSIHQQIIKTLKAKRYTEQR